MIVSIEDAGNTTWFMETCVLEQCAGGAAGRAVCSLAGYRCDRRHAPCRREIS